MKGFKDVIILVIISVVAGTALSVVYTATKDRIGAAKSSQLQIAIKQVLPFLEKESIRETVKYEETEYTLYIAYKDGKCLGAAIDMTTNEGFSGDIAMLIGVNNMGEVTGLRILEHKETPGLGSKAEDEKFWGQFLGKSLTSFNFSVKQDKGDVDAITAATITSRAVTNAVGKSLNVFETYKKLRGAI